MGCNYFYSVLYRYCARINVSFWQWLQLQASDFGYCSRPRLCLSHILVSALPGLATKVQHCMQYQAQCFSFPRGTLHIMSDCCSEVSRYFSNDFLARVHVLRGDNINQYKTSRIICLHEFYVT